MKRTTRDAVVVRDPRTQRVVCVYYPASQTVEVKRGADVRRGTLPVDNGRGTRYTDGN